MTFGGAALSAVAPPFTLGGLNFFGHVVIASAHDRNPGWILGTMLPDFASMAGGRLGEVRHEDVRRGVAFHHVTDDAFHGAPRFVDLMGLARDELEAQGVEMGPAMAVGHVGVELLLDGWLADREDALDAYRHALAEAPGLLDAIELRGADPKRMGKLLARLRSSEIPHAYRDPDFVADRLMNLLDHRPRLRPDAGQAATIRAWLHERAADLADRFAALHDEVLERLVEASAAPKSQM